jgi:hypothetical protein
MKLTYTQIQNAIIYALRRYPIQESVEGEDGQSVVISIEDPLQIRPFVDCIFEELRVTDDDPTIGELRKQLAFKNALLKRALTALDRISADSDLRILRHDIRENLRSYIKFQA